MNTTNTKFGCKWRSCGDDHVELHAPGGVMLMSASRLSQNWRSKDPVRWGVYHRGEFLGHCATRDDAKAVAEWLLSAVLDVEASRRNAAAATRAMAEEQKKLSEHEKAERAAAATQALAWLAALGVEAKEMDGGFLYVDPRQVVSAFSK